ncbi:MAG: hypothetical protein N3A01_03500 [Bacteroidales bacterium]|nr:hypothetical protein [Bacteroidales bacterium]
MTKVLIYILNTIILFFISLFQDTVKVEITAPEQVTAGTTFEVTVTIYKGDISGFANYTQYLPIGYTANIKEIQLGDFTFKDQKIIVGWMSLPPQPVIRFTYEIHVDPTAEGPLLLSGTFNYLKNKQKESVESTPVSVIIKPSELVSTTPDTSVEEFNLNNIFCYRQIVKSENEFIVNYLINVKGLQRDKLAKIQEKIPEGFNAIPVETNEGTFSFKDNSVKILWMALPPQQQFTVSYKLIPQTYITDKPQLVGAFSYMENGTTKMKPIIEKEFLNKPIMAEVQKQKSATYYSQQLTTQNQQQVSNQQQNIITQQQYYTQQQQKQQAYTQEKQQKTSTTYKPYQQKVTQAKEPPISQLYNIPVPETGVIFRVQIGAGRKKINYVAFFKSLNVFEKIRMEQHEGWFKYTVGKFDKYKNARDKRNEIWQTTPIKGAFVTAYNNGVRITVQEALMITNQKWIK